MNATTTTTTKATKTTTTQKLLTGVLALQVLTVLGLWTGQPRATSAQAYIPDPGAQREAMVEQQKVTNDKLDKLIELLKGGGVKVKVEQDGKK
jgi:hypothetical protein